MIPCPQCGVLLDMSGARPGATYTCSNCGCHLVYRWSLPPKVTTSDAIPPQATGQLPPPAQFPPLRPPPISTQPHHFDPLPVHTANRPPSQVALPSFSSLLQSISSPQGGTLGPPPPRRSNQGFPFSPPPSASPFAFRPTSSVPQAPLLSSPSPWPFPSPSPSPSPRTSAPEAEPGRSQPVRRGKKLQKRGHGAVLETARRGIEEQDEEEEEEAEAEAEEDEDNDDDDAAPEGVAAFITTPPRLACFLYNLLHRSPDPDDFYLMPCVGDGAIPLAWLRAGKPIGGGVFCELFATSLQVLERALQGLGWSLTIACTTEEWNERLRISAIVGAHLARRNELEKQREGFKRLETKSEKDEAEIVRLTGLIAQNKDDADNRQQERALAEPLYRGHLTRDSATIYLFQGNATLLFKRKIKASRKLIEILGIQARRHIVAVENLPWGRTLFLKKTANKANIEIMSAVLNRTSTGSRSAFIINRAGLVANTTSLVPRRIATLWSQGAITRVFPLPTGTFEGHEMPMACLFVFRKFTQLEQTGYSKITQLLRPKKRGDAAPLRYFCGLLSGEDLAWARLVKRATQRATELSVFADSALDHQNRILSDSSQVIYDSSKAQNPKADGKLLLQVPGQLADQLRDRLQEEAFTQHAEQAIEAMYSDYRRCVLHIAEPQRFITLDALKSSTNQEAITECQIKLLDALRAMTNRDEGTGNITFQPGSARRPVQHNGDVIAAHLEIQWRIRLVALVHRLIVPSFVLERLAFLVETFVQRSDRPGLLEAVNALYERERATAIAFLERRCETETAGQFLG